jgi:hypothetical protein
MDYNSLTEQIKQYSKRTDEFFISQIPNFINQAINRIYSEAKNIGFEKVVVSNGQEQQIQVNNSILAKPTDWKETVSFKIIIPPTNDLAILQLRTLEFCQSYWPTPTLTGTPAFYADFNNYSSFYLVPTPNQNYNFQLIYLALPLFNAQNPTNFLTLRYPSLLLYASMLETIPFLKGDERVPVFESLYNRALQSINKDAEKLYTDRVAKRDVD